MRRIAPVFYGLILLTALSILPALVAGQTTVTAEAIGQANMRARPDVNSELVGEIFSGTRYPVLGRAELVPWLLLGDTATQLPIGWVFQDLLNVSGNIAEVPISAVDVSQPFVPTNTPLPPGVTPDTTVPTPTATVAFTVTGVVSGEINIRYGPSIDFDRVGVGVLGERFEVTAVHTQLPWVQIRYDASPNGFAWVARDLLTYEGNIALLPGISQTSFNLPTLTPTSAPILTVVAPGEAPVPLSSSFQALGNRLWEVVFNGGFDPETSRFGALYIQDLQTGETITFGNDIAFSGTSINKIAILLELFNVLNAPPDAVTAVDIANTMICSFNESTNNLLSVIGEGDLLRGSDMTTQFLRNLGLQNTFLAAPFDTTNGILTPTAVPRALNIPSSTADQTRANVDFTNQLTVDEMGWLLGEVYQCAIDGSGAMSQTGVTQDECRRVLHVMSNNTVDALLRAGVPAEIPVAHKHGWIPDTHGNAAVMITPGGAYVIVMMLHQPEWLAYSESLPVIAEVSRTAYNFYNPDAPLDVIRDGFIPETADCGYAGDPLVNELISIDVPLRFTLPTPQPTTAPLPSATPQAPTLTPTNAG